MRIRCDKIRQKKRLRVEDHLSLGLCYRHLVAQRGCTRGRTEIQSFFFPVPGLCILVTLFLGSTHQKQISALENAAREA